MPDTSSQESDSDAAFVMFGDMEVLCDNGKYYVGTPISEAEINSARMLLKALTESYDRNAETTGPKADLLSEKEDPVDENIWRFKDISAAGGEDGTLTVTDGFVSEDIIREARKVYTAIRYAYIQQHETETKDTPYWQTAREGSDYEPGNDPADGSLDRNLYDQGDDITWDSVHEHLELYMNPIDEFKVYTEANCGTTRVFECPVCGYIYEETLWLDMEPVTEPDTPRIWDPIPYPDNPFEEPFAYDADGEPVTHSTDPDHVYYNEYGDSFVDPMERGYDD